MNISDFISGFNGGTRVNRFVVYTKNGNIGPAIEAQAGSDGGIAGAASSTLGATSNSTHEWPIHIRAAKIPELNMGVIPVNYRGKTVPFPGDRALSDWEIIVIDDTNPVSHTHLHRAFMDWSHAIVGTDSRLGVLNFKDATKWSSAGGNVWKVRQLATTPITTTKSSDPATVREFALYNCWPKEVGPLQLDMSTDNAINYFRVVMAYTHCDPYDDTNH